MPTPLSRGSMDRAEIFGRGIMWVRPPRSAYGCERRVLPTTRPVGPSHRRVPNHQLPFQGGTFDAAYRWGRPQRRISLVLKRPITRGDKCECSTPHLFRVLQFMIFTLEIIQPLAFVYRQTRAPALIALGVSGPPT